MGSAGCRFVLYVEVSLRKGACGRTKTTFQRDRKGVSRRADCGGKRSQSVLSRGGGAGDERRKRGILPRGSGNRTVRSSTDYLTRVSKQGSIRNRRGVEGPSGQGEETGLLCVRKTDSKLLSHPLGAGGNRGGFG